LWKDVFASPKKSDDEMNGVLEQIKAAFRKDDAASVRELLARYPDLKAKINEPIGGFDSPAILAVRSREMLDVLLAAGADINAKSRWWAGGFGLLHTASPELAAYAIERGAIVDIHAAARLGMMEKLAELVATNPELVHSRGGDGQTPLHFACTIEIAKFLLDQGAMIDARDVDHESTPAQWMVRERQDIARYLITRGCATDILMAAALGDLDLVRKHLDADPDAIHMRVSDEYFPMIGGKTGGTIYQWTLGWYVSAHQIAKAFGHEHVFQFLLERSPNEIKLITACWLGDEAMMNSLLAAEPNLVARLNETERCQLAHAARNNDLTAVRLMLAAGLPVGSLSQHKATPLHWAAFQGNAEMAELILQKNPPLEATDADFNSTPLGWAIYGSEHGWHPELGNYAATVEALLRAGAKPPQEVSGSAEVRQVLLRKTRLEQKQ
jgi:ankyrin repeat protein